MAVVSVIYEANQLCHAFDNDPLLFKITIHSLVMCHKAKYQTWSKTLMCNKFISDLHAKLSPILSPTHLFRIYKDFNYKKILQWPRREIGPFNSWLGSLQSGRSVKLDSLFLEFHSIHHPLLHNAHVITACNTTSVTGEEIRMWHKQ